MAKGFCETCDRPIGISPTGERIHKDPDSMFRSAYWRLDLHKCRGPLREICPGSGEKI